MTNTRTPWRYRRCPACRAVRPAGEYAALSMGPSWQDGYSRRRCPGCGHCGPTRTFAVVYEDRNTSGGRR